MKLPKQIRKAFEDEESINGNLTYKIKITFLSEKINRLIRIMR